MAFLLGRKRLVGTLLETTSGTVNAPNMSNDNIPLLRSVQPTIEPISVERPILRLTMTPYGDIYPGKSIGSLDVVFELTSSAAFTGLSGNTNPSAGMRSPASRTLQIAGMVGGSPPSVTDLTINMHSYKVTGVGVDNGPLRHGELVTNAPNVTSGDNWTVIGDCYSDDGVIHIAEILDEGAVLSATTFTGVDSGSVFNITAATRGPQHFVWRLNSNVNAAINGVGQATVDFYDDGKRLRLKGCAAEVEFMFDHGDAIRVHATYRGVVDSYVDQALPATPFEAIKSPPKFIGTRVSLRNPLNVPGATGEYGLEAAGSIVGSLNTMRLKTGNEIVLPQNSIDPNGVNFALITGRVPGGSFNPYEVLSTSEFDFLTNFFQGKPLRLRIGAVGPGGTPTFDDPSTTNNNIWDFIAPGIVLSHMGDTNRDGINTWDGQFKLTGGNYTAAVAQSETPGQDNEFTIIHR